jgi:hypothetical protein
VEWREGWVFQGSGGVFWGRFWGADGRFYREISGFLSDARARRGDSAHGGHGRASWAKKFLKIFKKRGENPKNWGARGVGRWSGRTLI